MTRGSFPGEALRARREQLGLTHQQVYAETRVAPEHVLALELGRLDVFPVTTYVAGYITSYCRALGLAPEPFLLALRAYEAAQGPASAPARTQPRPIAMTPRPRQRSNERPAWLNDALTWGAVCAFILLGWLTYTAIVHPFVEAMQSPADAAPDVELLQPPQHFPEEDF